MRKALLAVAALVALSSAQAMALDLKLGHVYDVAHPWHIGVVKAAELAKERTGGRVNITVFPSSVLGTEAELTEQVLTGGLDMAESGSGNLANVYPAMNITEMPYIFRDNNHVMQFLKSSKFQEIKDDLYQETSGRILASSTWGMRHIIGNRPVVTPDDMKGFKLRVPEQNIAIEYAKAMGGMPTPVAYAEAYMALQQKVCDGLENPLVSIQSMKFHEVANVLSLTGHIISVVHVVISDNAYNKIDPADRDIVKQAFIEGCDHIHELMDKSDRELTGFFKDQGLTIIEANRDLFREATKSMSVNHAKEWEKFGDVYQYIQDLK